MRGSWLRANGLFLLLAIVGMVELVYTTRSGPGVSPDSVQYLYAARTFLEGRGFLSIYVEGGNGALTHYPPGYPMALSLAALCTPGGSLTSAGTGFGVLLWGINLFLVMWLLRRYTGRTALALVVGFFLMTSLDLLRIHEMIWSEPLFFLLSLLALWKTAEHCDKGTRRDLVIAIICTAMAAITRYIGVVLICSVAFVVFARAAGGFAQRFRRASIAATLSALPLSAWLVHGKLVSGSMTNRSLGYHPMTADYWDDLLGSLGEFFLQVLQLEAQSRIAGGALILLSVFLAFRYRKALAAGLRNNTFAFALVCCNMGYLLFLLLSNTFLDRTPLYYRIIYPVLVQLIIALLLLADQWVPLRDREGPRRKGLLLLLSLYCALHAFDHARYVFGKSDPNGYCSAAWTSDPVLAYVKAHPGAVVLSNAIDALYVHTGRFFPGTDAMGTTVTGAYVAIFREGQFYNGRSFDEDLSVTNSYAPSVRLELVDEGPNSRLYRVR